MSEKQMTDNELRAKLKQLGVDVGPITDTTRKLYEKKLNQLLNENIQDTKKNRRRSAPIHPVQKRDTPQSSLIQFSSEESDLDLQGESDIRKRRRRTLPPSQLHSSVNSKDSDPSPNTSQTHEFKSPVSPPPKSLKGSSDVSVNSILKRSSLRSSKRLSLNHSSFDIDTSDSDFDIDKQLTAMKKRRSLGGLMSEHSSANSFNASFTPSPLSVNLKSKHNAKTGQSVSNSSSSSGLGKSSFQANGQRKQPKESDKSLEWEFSGDEESTGLQHVPHLLVALVAFFFIIVGVLYVGVRQTDTRTASLTTNGFSHWTCKGLAEDGCVPKENLELALIATRHLYNILSDQAGHFECDPTNYPKKYITFHEAKNSLFHVSDLQDQKLVDRVFDNCIFLMKKNPDWGLTVLQNDNGDGYALEAQVARKSLLCRLQQAFQRIFKQLCLALTVILGIYGCFVYFNHRRQKKRIFETQLFELIEKIVDTLQQNQENAGLEKDTFMPVVHVRDMLIPLSERNNKDKQRLWEAAVSFLESNESRIRSEHQRIAGEDFLVWRWLQPSSPYTSSISSFPSTFGDNETRKSKVWQGQAFGTSGKGGNVLPFCPTPCLKIRNMFDPEVEFGTDWPQYIRNAILEKCESTHGIFHVHVDTSSKEGCVYVKCNSQESAGQVYRSLHGWWFDGNLITVKYLRLERYHERFPDARLATTPLKPSNNLQLSLQPLHNT